MALNRQQLRSGLISLGICVLVFGTVPVLLKSFTRFLDAWTVNALRYSVAALIWAPFVLTHRAQIPGGLRSLWVAALVPSVANLGAQVGWALAPYYNDATVISFVVRSSFAFTILFSLLLLREERAVVGQPLFWAACAGMAAGVVAMYWGGIELGNMTPLGVTVLVVDAAFWGLYAVCVRRFLGAYPARLAFGVISLYTAAALWALGLALGDWSPVPGMSLSLWGQVILSAVLGIAVGHVFLYRAIGIVGPIVTEGTFSLVPFVAAFTAMLALGERLSLLQWAGGCLLVASSYLLLRAKAASA